ncbi:MAG: hypothetical protein ACK56F_03260 [bacterium]
MRKLSDFIVVGGSEERKCRFLCKASMSSLLGGIEFFPELRDRDDIPFLLEGKN